MLSGKYISIDFIIDRIFQDYGFTREIDRAEVAERVYDAMSYIGVPDSYVRTITNGEGDNPDPIAVVDYRAELPCNMYKVISVREDTQKYPMQEVSSTFRPGYKDDGGTEGVLSYHINDDFIFTSFETGTIEVSYLALPTDEYGLPKIPDDVVYIRAVVSFVAERIGFRLYMQDKLSEKKYEKLNQEWLWYVGAAQGRSRIPSPDKAEMLKNVLAKMVANSNHHLYNFKYLGFPERLKIHP